MRTLCSGGDAHLLLAALTEMYARVLSGCIDNEPEMEKALTVFQRHVRGWWLADRGGSYLVS